MKGNRKFTGWRMVFACAFLLFCFRAVAALEPATPESQGVPSAAIMQWLDACEKTFPSVGSCLHGFVIVRHGKVIAEGTWKPFDTLNRPHMLYSHSKSFTSTAIGFLVDEGKVDLDERVAAIFPDKVPAKPSAHLTALRVRDLLTMNVGADYTDAENKDIAGDWVRAFLANEIATPPGTKFKYDSCATHMLAAIVERRSGRKLMDYLRGKLFDPLAIKTPWTTTSPDGIACGGWGMNMSTRDLAAFGQFYLQRGAWEGKRVLSSEWIDLATARQTWSGAIKVQQQVIGSGNDWSQGYGFQFWRCVPPDVYRADGAFGQYTVVMPCQDAVVSINASCHDMAKELALVWQHLLPAFGEKPLPANDAAVTALRNRCAALALRPVVGRRVGTAAFEGKRFALAANRHGLAAVTLLPDADGWLMTLETPAGTSRIPVGYAAWRMGNVMIDTEKYERLGGLVGTFETASSAAVSSNGTLVVETLLLGTPTSLSFVFSEQEGAATVSGRLRGMGGENLKSASPACVKVRLPAYGSTVAVNDAAHIDFVAYQPNWAGFAPTRFWKNETTWHESSEGLDCTWRATCQDDIELECVGLQFSFNLGAILGRAWSAGKTRRTIPPTQDGSGFGRGKASRFVFPLANDRAVTAVFPADTPYSAQDGRQWGDTWFIRFNPRGRRCYKKGETFTWTFTLKSADGVACVRQKPVVIAANETWARLENRKDILPDSALDFSGLGLQDAPAGKYGWLQAKKGNFVFEKRPEKEQRFYGVNLCFSACYPSHAQADRLVMRLARLGYNAIRLHHHDDTWRHRPAEREKFDYLVAQAVKQGLYITTDVYVSCAVAWREIGIDRAGTLPKNLFKSLVAVNDRAYANWCAFAEDFFNHVNPYTQRAYRDEPGMPLISLINEGGLPMGFGDDKANNPDLIAAWRAFSDDAAAKVVPHPATKEGRAFNEELNRRLYGKASAFLRGLGVKALLTNDNNGGCHGVGEGAAQLYDYVDNHFYVDHPQFVEKKWSLPSRCPNKNPIRTGEPRIFSRGYAKDAPKPYTITEWNFSGPGRFRALGGLLTCALAMRDGWDGLWRFAYSHDNRNFEDGARQSPGYFDCATDPLSQAGDRAAVMLFLRGDAAQGTLDVDRAHGTMSFVAPQTCGGFAEFGVIRAGALTATLQGAPAAVWVSSLEAASVECAARRLLVHITDVQGDGAEYADEARTLIRRWGKGCLVEKGGAQIALASSAPAKVYALDTTGKRLEEVPSDYASGHLSFTADTARGAIYYEIIHCPSR